MKRTNELQPSNQPTDRTEPNRVPDYFIFATVVVCCCRHPFEAFFDCGTGKEKLGK